MNALPASIRNALSATVNGYTVTLDAIEGLIEVSSAAGTLHRAPFYAPRGFSTLPLSVSYEDTRRLEGALYGLVLPALAALRAHVEAHGASEALDRAYATLCGLSAAARLHALRQTRAALRAA